MNGLPSTLLLDIALAVQTERIERSAANRMGIEAAGARARIGIVHSLRRGFGRALIALGQSVHGERIDSRDYSPVPGSGAIRLAR